MSTVRHANSFTLVRFVLASAVVFGHAYALIGRPDPMTSIRPSEGITIAGLAVDGFFLLSGFLITASYLADSRPGRYLSKRVRRILPGFAVAYGFTLLVVGPRAASGPYLARQDWPRLARGLLTMKMPDGMVGVFVDNECTLLNGSLWTIRYEFGCYLAVLGLGLAGWLRRPRIVLALAVVAALGHALQFWVWSPTAGGYRSHQTYPIPRFLSFFLAGAVFQLYRERLRLSGPVLALAALTLLGCMAWPPTYRAFGPWLGAAVLLGVGSRSSALGRWFDGMPDVSYGLYLYAFPIQNLLIARFGPNLMVSLVLAWPLCVLAGLASWYGVERAWVRARRPGWPWLRGTMATPVGTSAPAPVPNSVGAPQGV